MGFFDKVLSKVGAALATRYGSVVSGKYAGCKIVLGNPPTEKVSVANSFSQIIFLSENEEKGRYNIINDIEDITYVSTSDKGYHCVLTFSNGETVEFDLFKERAKIFVLNTKACMLNETSEFFEKELNI